MSGWMIGDAGEHVGNVELRIEAVELGAFDQAVHERRPLTTPIGTGEQPCPSSEGNRPVILPMSGTN
jgi:hypothetical protein